MLKAKIVIVDDEKDMRDFLEIMLRKEGYEVTAMSSARSALEYCRGNNVDLAITDLKMPGMSGIEFLREVKEGGPDIPVIMITAYASVETAIDAMKAGAYDYFIKPFNIDEVKLNVRNAVSHRRLIKENRLLKDDLMLRVGFQGFIGVSQRMGEVYALIKNVSRTKSNVFITGESGTGKELAARAIHFESDRKESPFVAVNCGAIPENLLESELFGHMKGAFTGAVTNKEGLAEKADGGVFFLDEITELPLHLQVKLLRFIQERNFRRVGGTADITVDIRLIAASNRDIEADVKAGRFREDLFYRLNVIRIEMPALRERKEDISALAMHFIEKFRFEHGKNITKLSDGAMSALMAYEYPGNVRELENIIEHAVALESGDTIMPESLPSHLKGGFGGGEAGSPLLAELPPGGIDLEKNVEVYEKTMIRDALKRAGGVKKKAAQLLGLSFRSMRYKLSKYGIGEN
ncbi:sigma-54-dependent Fis family transcriptional regulator [bacterium]|nr:MAG: sigma-54-dependent Fis family transcriptional regulator [bacterium]